MFTSTLQVEEQGQGRWRLTKDLGYQGKADHFTVPTGFVSDFASVPRLFRWLVPTSGEYTKGAVLHDYLCDTGTVSRKDADGIFRRVLRELQVSLLRRYVMWGAVRIGGKLRGITGGQLLLIALLLILVLPIAIPGTVLGFVALVLLWVAEVTTWLTLRLFGKKVTRPTSFWWT